MTSIVFKRTILLIIFVINSSSFIFAGGAQEGDQLDEAYAYIEKKEYDKALLVLSKIIETKSDDLDQAEILAKKVREIKNGVTTLLEELIKIVETDPGNKEAIVAIVDKIKKVQPNLNSQQTNFIDTVYVQAKLNVDRNKRKEIFALAKKQIDAKNYLAAFQIYTTGFDLQKEEFETGLQTPEFRQKVYAEVAGIEAAYKKALVDDETLSASLRDFGVQFGADVQTYNTQAMQAAFDRVALAYQNFYKSKANLLAITERITNYRNEAENLHPKEFSNEYIRFIQEFLNGIDSAKGQEGIKAVANFYNKSQIANWMGNLETAMQKLSSERDNLIAQDDGLGAIAKVTELEALFKVYQNAVFTITQTPTTNTLASIPFKDLSGDYVNNYVNYWIRDRSDRVLVGYLDTWYNSPKNPPEDADFKAIFDVYQKVAGLISSPGQAYVSWQSEMLLPKILNSEALNKSGQTADELLNAWYQKISTNFLDLAHITNTRLAKLEFDQASVLYQTILSNRGKMVQFVDGKPFSETAQANVSVGDRFPDQALNLAPIIETDLAKSVSLLDSILSRDASASQKVVAFADVQKQDSDSRDLKAKLQTLSTFVARYKATADKNKKEAERLMAETNSLLAETNNFINNRKPRDAQVNLDSIEIALKNIRNNYWYQKSFDDKTKEEFARLNSALTNLRVAIATEDIKKLLKTGTDQLNNSEYDDALASVEKAEAIQKSEIDKDKPDADVQTLRIRIQNAATASRELQIVESDPNYNTVANLLNISTSLLSKAKVSGTTANEKTKLLTLAEQNVDSISLIKPNNWDASLLRLEIKKYQGTEEEFRTYLKNRFKIVKDSEGANPIAARIQYKVLLTYSPTDKAILAAIDNIDQKLGEPARITEETKRQAKTLFDPIKKDYRTANAQRRAEILDTIPRIKQLTPDYNGELDQIKGFINSKNGTPSPVKLTEADMVVFRAAQTQVASGQVGLARPAINRLWANVAYRSYGPLVELYYKVNP